LLLVLASTAILGSEFQGTDDHASLSDDSGKLTPKKSSPSSLPSIARISPTREIPLFYGAKDFVTLFENKLQICSHEEGKRYKTFVIKPRLILDSRASNDYEFSLLISPKFERPTRP
jgi:hypothetical protein